MSVTNNVAAILERVRSAARRVARDPDSVSLMAVSKTVPAELIREAYAAGIRLFGESRIQEFAGKKPSVQDLPDASWHMIGHLQTNKASKAVELFSAVDSIDSLRLAEKLNAEAEKADKHLDILIEINVAGESAKSGTKPGSEELNQIFESAAKLQRLHLRGLMSVPPFAENPENARPYFRKLRDLRDQISARFPSMRMDVLSMGMSHDFEVAIEEGATCVRVGTALFGDRMRR